jgi:hypothetical protein
MTAGGEGLRSGPLSDAHKQNISHSLLKTFSQSRYKTSEYLTIKKSIAIKNMKNFVMPGLTNVNSIGTFITPWGTFESANQAAFNANINYHAIINYCLMKNNEPIRRVTRSNVATKFPFTREHIGKTYRDLGFSFIPKEP